MIIVGQRKTQMPIFPRTYNRSNEYFINQQNTFWLHKTDYIRLKNIELGYTVPSIWSKKIGVEHFSLFIHFLQYINQSVWTLIVSRFLVRR